MMVYVASETRTVIAVEGDPEPQEPGFWFDLPGVPEGVSILGTYIATGVEDQVPPTQAEKDAFARAIAGDDADRLTLREGIAVLVADRTGLQAHATLLRSETTLTVGELRDIMADIADCVGHLDLGLAALGRHLVRQGL